MRYLMVCLIVSIVLIIVYNKQNIGIHDILNNCNTIKCKEISLKLDECLLLPTMSDEWSICSWEYYKLISKY